ncbi:MAG: hypothetical protein ACTIDY_07950 [Halomonadaceae bacterium]|uniref:Uncharacterized protein n=1 Tax=Halomonas colorata TaxID=2742615 RepID=A0ABR9FYR2_9GAMM|nr:hypothetical protein [Halomonas colorata]MBE0463779.1 hypothetical protein [Halomonas colorata]
MYLNLMPSLASALGGLKSGLKSANKPSLMRDGVDDAELDEYFHTAQELGLSRYKAEEIFNHSLRKARRRSDLSMSDVIFRAYCTIHLHTYH